MCPQLRLGGCVSGVIVFLSIVSVAVAQWNQSGGSGPFRDGGEVIIGGDAADGMGSVDMSWAAVTPVYARPAPIAMEGLVAWRQDLADAARSAFRRGDYGSAIRWGAHAAVEDPRDQQMHLLLAMSMCAMSDYRGAEREVRAMVSNNQIPDWATLSSLYGDVQTFTGHLRALEGFVWSHSSAVEGRFLLGFVYLAEGYPDAARTELAQAARLAPHDRSTQTLLAQAGGPVVPGIVEQPLRLPNRAAATPHPSRPPLRAAELPRPTR
jgi:hypothetical protein